MSSGLVVCSKCKREVHQGDAKLFPPKGWYHCIGTRWDADTPICEGAKAIWPPSQREINGPFCGVDNI